MNQHVPPPPAVIPPQSVDVPRAQVDAINCLIAIIDEPYTGYGVSHFAVQAQVLGLRDDHRHDLEVVGRPGLSTLADRLNTMLLPVTADRRSARP
jgi:hypothetical protein